VIDDPEEPSGSPWDLSVAAYEVRLPGILRENHRFARQVQRDAREARGEWTVTPVDQQRWSLTKTGTRTASHVEVRTRTRRRGPLRQLLTAAAAALHLVPRDVVDPAARGKALVIDWDTQPDSTHHLALSLPRRRGMPSALQRSRDGT